MAKKTGKAPKKKPLPETSGGSRFPGWMLKLALFLAAAGAVYVFRDRVAEEVFTAIGFGVILAGFWAVAIFWVLWRRHLASVRYLWNTWLAVLGFSVSMMGIMSLFSPGVSLAGVSMKEVTLSGNVGQEIAGDSWEWARLTGMVLLSIILFAPRESLLTTRQVSATTWEWTRPMLIALLIRLSRWLRRFFIWLGHLIPRVLRAIWRFFVAEPSPAKSAPRPRTVRNVAVRNPPATEVSSHEVEDDATGEQLAMPGLIDSELPPIELLNEAPRADFVQADDDERARLIEEALGSYGVEVKVTQINPGPSVTQFGVEPGWVRKYKRVIEKDQDGKPVLDREGNPRYHMEEISKTRVKVERITSLANDLALALAVSDIRIEAPIPGKAMVGIEVPNTSTAIVSLRGVIESQPFQKMAGKSRLTTALGLGPGGEAVAGDIAKMPHLLIAGATGSGKSVCLNCIVACVMALTSPHDVRLVLIDPKRVEMVNFSEIPHLITPVVVDSEKAVETLRRVTMEMDNRYQKFASFGVRNIEAYNRHARVTQKMPYLMVIIDELADLMMTTPDVVEPLLCRLAQLARATGIHLIVATQRPSVDVITGLIKANFPTRISFAVVSSIDSRTILDTIGAEKLLGKGDMLYIPPEANKPKRIRGCFVSDEEIERLVTFWKGWAERKFPPEVDMVAREFESLSVAPVEMDPFMEKARQICREVDKISASLLQRKLHVGYQRASRLMDQLEEEGLLNEEEETVGPWEGEL